MKKVVLLAFCLYLLFLSVNAVEDEKIVRVRLESCPGCKLNRLHEVKAFVYEDFPKYDNAEFKKIQGAPPELLFLNDADEVVEKHSLETLSRAQCNELLTNRGFVSKSDKEL